MKAIYVIGIIALLSVMMITPASATTVNIVTDADTHVKSYVPDSNFGDSPELPVEWYDDSGYGVKRALTHFNLSSIPVDATIDAATLHLYVGSRFDYGTPTYNIHRIEESWGEMTPTWNNQPGYTPTPIDSIIKPTCADCWDVYDVTSDVQDFVEGTSINYGWLIKLEMEDDPEWPGTYYRSREHGSDTSPYLEVTYTESAPLEFGDAPDPNYPSLLASD
ncbi:MAG: DNRLRE domain-containing protein, partial [Methanosarcinales archaeon]|nr:DNRLRE domain-containing protein [Methanosarcinales archaeon]